MTFFDTRIMDLYFVGFFSIAALAVALALAVGVAEIRRHRRVRGRGRGRPASYVSRAAAAR